MSGPSGMDHDEHIDAIERESAAFVVAATAVDSDARVPSCPDWSADDLLRHLGTVQRWAAGMVEQRAAEPAPRVEVDTPADRDELLAWVRSGSAGLVAVLRATPPDTALWTFPGPGEARFWSRRQAHEIAMHRVDMQLADQRAGGPLDPIQSDLAGDGIDEFFEVIAPFRLRNRLVGAGETLHFHRTDGDGEWLVRLTPDGPEIERAHAKGDVAVRGGASDLLLVLRNRARLDSVEVFGDATLIDRWHELASI
jgi:uncharacterized protein (TIGR03083 family)